MVFHKAFTTQSGAAGRRRGRLVPVKENNFAVGRRMGSYPRYGDKIQRALTPRVCAKGGIK